MADERDVEVREGEHLAAIAAEHGINWKNVWDASAELRESRKNPHLLQAGDRVKIPVDKKQSDDGVATEKEHAYEADRPWIALRVQILDFDFKPVANAEYELQVQGEGEPRRGKTNDQGEINEENLPPKALTATLVARVPAPKGGEKEEEASTEDEGSAEPGEGETPAGEGDIPCVWELSIGGLDPLGEEAPDEECLPGVQQRLYNLGYYNGEITGEWNDETRAAIRRFRKDFGLPDGEESDKALQSKLLETHDQPGPPPERQRGEDEQRRERDSSEGASKNGPQQGPDVKVVPPPAQGVPVGDSIPDLDKFLARAATAYGVKGYKEERSAPAKTWEDLDGKAEHIKDHLQTFPHDSDPKWDVWDTNFWSAYDYIKSKGKSVRRLAPPLPPPPP